MRAAPAAVPPSLPGTSASGATKGMAIFVGAVDLIFFMPVTLLEVSWGGEGGHLPWPAVQWAVTTPIGALVLIALCLVALGPPLALFWRRWFRRELARAIDVTDVPWAAWPGFSWQLRSLRPSLRAWLGQGRREQVRNLLLLALGILLTVGMLSIIFASVKYEFGPLPCDTHGIGGCAPFYPISQIVIAGQAAGIALACMDQFRWLRRVEATSGVWLRHRERPGLFWITRLYYLRPSGVTAEAASAALARLSGAQAVPYVRRFFAGLLFFLPYILLASLSLFLNHWLQLQWIPS